MPLRAKRIYENAEPDDGYRLLVMRLWPRGIHKEHVDAWERQLAPTRNLLTDYRSHVIDWAEYERRYLHEMTSYSDSIRALSALRWRISQGNVTILCSCKDEMHCHRTLLSQLVQKNS